MVALDHRESIFGNDCSTNPIFQIFLGYLMAEFMVSKNLCLIKEKSPFPCLLLPFEVKVVALSIFSLFLLVKELSSHLCSVFLSFFLSFHHLSLLYAFIFLLSSSYTWSGIFSLVVCPFLFLWRPLGHDLNPLTLVCV